MESEIRTSISQILEGFDLADSIRIRIADSIIHELQGFALLPYSPNDGDARTFHWFFVVLTAKLMDGNTADVRLEHGTYRRLFGKEQIAYITDQTIKMLFDEYGYRTAPKVMQVSYLGEGTQAEFYAKEGDDGR